MPATTTLIQSWPCSAATTGLTISSQTITSLMPQFYIGELTVFIPTGSGQLWYHSIPTNPATALQQTWANQWAIQAQQGYTTLPSRPALARPPLIHAGRRALRRSIDLLRRFRPEHDVKAFLDGRPLLLHGHRYDYRVRSRGNLLEHTMNPRGPHIPYDLHIVSKCGRTLAKGCIIVPDTPVVDQVLALALHVQDEEAEEVIVRTTNWSPRLERHQLAA